MLRHSEYVAQKKLKQPAGLAYSSLHPNLRPAGRDLPKEESLKVPFKVSSSTKAEVPGGAGESEMSEEKSPPMTLSPRHPDYNIVD